jgi:hypothetical protein
MACLVGDVTGWVCENHPDRSWRSNSQRADACDCGPGNEGLGKHNVVTHVTRPS